jgi:hypothetical protein
MPISTVDGCSEAHWSDVREILFEAIEAANFEPHLVSDADDVGIIQKRIIQNLYDNPIVVCDVSGKNPNVMFELGLRLAFDKPTVIVKDDKTAYSFDTAPIEHLEYPRDLRFSRIVEFKGDLADKITGTHKKATKDTDYTTFLKHFGSFSVAKLETKNISRDEFLLDEIRSLKRVILGRASDSPYAHEMRPFVNKTSVEVCLRGLKVTDDDLTKILLTKILPTVKARSMHITMQEPDHVHLSLDFTEPFPPQVLMKALAPFARHVRVFGGAQRGHCK